MTRIGFLQSGSSSRLALVFLAVLLPAAVTLVWLGWKLLDQDRALAATRAAERRQVSAEAVVASLDRSLAEAEHWLSGDVPPEGSLRVTVSSSGLRVQPANRALWVPVPPVAPEAAKAPFAEAELLEFRGPAARALPVYEKTALAGDPALRAGALLRLARTYRRTGRTGEALAAYHALANMRAIGINGLPADLLARRAACDLLEAAGRKQELAREATALALDFTSGRWILDRPNWTMAAADLARWTGAPLSIPEDRQALSAAADWIWSEWRDRASLFSASGRRVIDADETLVTLLWRRDGPALAAVAILPSVVNGWIQSAAKRNAGPAARVTLTTESGRWIAGREPASDAAVLKLASADTRLPWTVAVASDGGAADMREIVLRERLLSLGLAAIVLLLAGGSWWLWRVMRRELAVARLQADFVSAVSHEFRTPLTSLQHLTELLEEDDNLPPGRRRAFYSSLGRNTERLHRLVESLLDFGRMESGRRPYELRPEDAADLAAKTVAEFQKDAGTRGFTVDLELNGARECNVRADRVALTHALWNLLDNAAKYSAESRAIWVSVRRQADGIAIAVRDAGLGVPSRERKEIFRKFVRGEKAKQLGIKGTGLGLALVSHIVEAHGGRIELESSEGGGSTFRLVLPALG
ncbi:MAG TPA: HAMP domain-containing sensor histidine kinase [Bryobacteraceae bacterium]|nr:HAMP domain-containing sensor histidine kinase [Bryobacteraceae bacterium]